MKLVASTQELASSPAEVSEAPWASMETGRSQRDFLRVLFRVLEVHSVRYCVLHSWAELPDRLLSDLDICVHPEDRGKMSIAVRALQTAGFSPLQCFHYSAGAFYYVFGWRARDEFRLVCLDVLFEHWRSGLCVLDVSDTVSSRRWHKGFWIAAPDAEFSYLLAKRAWKSAASEAQAERLKELAERLGAARAEEIASRMFLGGWGREVAAACLEGNLAATLKRAHRIPWATALVRHPLGLLRFLAREAGRRTRRCLKHTGLLVVVLGTDGAGKSTLVEHLDSQIGPAFRRIKRFHWTPRVIVPKEERAPSTNPHSRAVRGPVLSCCFLLGFVVDYWLGYWASLGRLRARSCLILFDRYFHDILVDPRRYRYGGPRWLAGWMTRFIPTPDLVLILDANEQALAERKAELPLDEIVRQRREYTRLRFPRSRTFVVNTEQAKDLVLREVGAKLFEHLAARFEKHHPEWLRTGESSL